MEAFKTLSNDAGMCVAKIEPATNNAEDHALFDRIIRNLREYKNARVVACFCEGMTVRGLLSATKRLNVSGEFLFVGRLVSSRYTSTKVKRFSIWNAVVCDVAAVSSIEAAEEGREIASVSTAEVSTSLGASLLPGEKRASLKSSSVR